MTSPMVLLVEDERGLSLTLGDRLRAEGHRVVLAETLRDAARALDRDDFDLVILDRMLPDGDGLDLCRQLRERGSATPVLMLTARNAVSDRVTGLRAGSDDYLVKPFDTVELLARVEALLRRTGWLESGSGGRYRFGDVVIDIPAAECRVGGVPVALSARLFRLLCFFIEHRGEMLSRDRLLNEVWGYDSSPSTRTVDVHVAWLRRRIEADPSNPVHIVTVHGLGYKFVG
ncbi:MAG: response regulator transcription factor [Gammaproteobacteria bacterium]